MSLDLTQLARDIKLWARELGFAEAAISAPAAAALRPGFEAWLAAGHHGDMQWLGEHMDLRFDPAQLEPGTLRVVSVRMDYLPEGTEPVRILKSPQLAYVSRYALGRDYHKLMRKRLAQLAGRIREAAPEVQGLRPFVDSAPVLEREHARRAGLGWIGKNTLLLNRHAGSLFFLGELLVGLELPEDPPPHAPEGCGDCTACLKVCPTDAFVAPYVLDARRCISYLTIEHAGPIDPELRPGLGNRVFGCDDCQLICPWNKFAQPTAEPDFQPRHGLDDAELGVLFQWSEAEFLQRTQGSALRRAGYERWQRNLAVALGNAAPDADLQTLLTQGLGRVSALVDEHIEWALTRQRAGLGGRRVKVRRREAGS